MTYNFVLESSFEVHHHTISDGQVWRKSQNKKGGKFELKSQLCYYNCMYAYFKQLHYYEAAQLSTQQWRSLKILFIFSLKVWIEVSSKANLPDQLLSCSVESALIQMKNATHSICVIFDRFNEVAEVQRQWSSSSHVFTKLRIYEIFHEIFFVWFFYKVVFFY